MTSTYHRLASYASYALVLPHPTLGCFFSPHYSMTGYISKKTPFKKAALDI